MQFPPNAPAASLQSAMNPSSQPSSPTSIQAQDQFQEKEPFSMIFMDIQMPHLDGIQSTRCIRELGFSAPIVALTAFTDESNRAACEDVGMNSFLPKPIRRTALKQVLAQFAAPPPVLKEEAEDEGAREKGKENKTELVHGNDTASGQREGDKAAGSTSEQPTPKHSSS